MNGTPILFISTQNFLSCVHQWKRLNALPFLTFPLKLFVLAAGFICIHADRIIIFLCFIYKHQLMSSIHKLRFHHYSLQLPTLKCQQC